MADIRLHFNKESGKYKCNYCGHDLAATTSTTRLRGHLIGVPNTGTKSCQNVPDDVRKYLSLCEINKRQKTATGYIPSPSNHPPVATEGMTVAMTTLVLPPNGSGASNYLGNQRQENHLREDEIADMIRGLSGANNHYIPIFSPELNNDFGNQGGVLQYMMSTHPNESGSVENLPLPNDMIGRTTQLQHQFTTEDLIQTPLEEQTNKASLMEETSNFPLGGRARMAPNESVLSSAADLISQDLRNFRLTDQADQHEVRDEVTVPQAVQMVEGIQETGESASLTNRPVGDAFGRNVEKIWSWLMDDHVLRVGICGMGGVGKTTLMRHIQTRLKGQSSLKVFWVTVSQDFSIWKLQNLIAKKIGLTFSDEEDEVDRAEKLTQSLKAKGKCVLILDDLWNDVELDKMGIPVGVNTCKLVLTTRLLEVCRQMDCSERNTIQVQRLSEEEAWILFTQELGNYSTEVEELAKAVSRECAGLSLGIKVMARSMKGSFNVHTWRNTLEELKESKVSKGHKMREEVFSVLKFSYLHLNDPALQECLSYFALFPEDDKISRGELIEYMIVEGIIDERKSRQAELDKGHTMLDTLENACLLEGDTETVWMHDLIRDMLILELREGPKTLVEAGAQLIELPDVEKWTENLVRVSLINNYIEVIPSSHAPRCPNLSTLLLCRNHGLKMIADSFFEQFQKLKILDLTWCNEIEELPRSISDLVNLTALLLGDCTSLLHVPSLAKLEKLKRLDLSNCRKLKQMPEGVRFLLNLKYLDLSRSGIEEIGSGIIPMLSRLQVLKLGGPASKFSIRGSEVGELRMLETLYCRFSNVREYMKSRERSQQSPSHYSICIARENPSWPIMRKLGSGKFVSVTGDNFIDPLALPTDIEALKIFYCDSTLYKGLFPPSLLASLLNLQEIRVGKWGAIEEIFAMNEGESGERGFPFSNYSTHSLPNHSLLNLKLIDIDKCYKVKKLFPLSLLPNLHNLQKISVQFCYDMEEIFSTDREEEDAQEWMGFPTHSLSDHSLLNLKKINIQKCHKLKKLFPPNLLPNLHNLQKISVDTCKGMEEIFSTNQEEELLFDPPNLTGLHLSRLTTLDLRYLPELRSIYKGTIICHSLQQIQLVDCPKLKRVTLPLPQPSLQRIQANPKEWWESVQWGEANDKIHLQSLAGFSTSIYF